MAPKLYTNDLSPPCRTVYLTTEALGLKLDYSEINFAKDDQLQPGFVKLNPQHTIPTLEDDVKIIWDSHAIIIYLVTKYGQDDSLYPQEPFQRAVVDQRLHFDSGSVFVLIRRIVRIMIYKGVKTVPQDLIEESIQTYEFLERFLENQQWVAGNQLTIADFSLLSSITSLDILVPIDVSKFPNILAWIQRAQQLPYYQVNQKGLGDFQVLVRTLMS